SKVAMLVGAGALNATDEIIEVAQRLDAGVAKALLGKAAVMDDLPFVTGSIGLLGTKPSWDMMSECDTLLMVGSSFPYSEFLPEEGQARGVQIDRDGRKLNLRYPMELGLIGDSRETLRALLPLLKPKKDHSWREQIESNVERWWRVLESRAMSDSDPVNPQRGCGQRIGRARNDGRRCALWQCRQARLPRAACHCVGWRRCQANERHYRLDYRGPSVAAKEEPAFHHSGAEQWRSESGHLGTA